MAMLWHFITEGSMHFFVEESDKYVLENIIKVNLEMVSFVQSSVCVPLMCVFVLMFA